MSCLWCSSVLFCSVLCFVIADVRHLTFRCWANHRVVQLPSQNPDPEHRSQSRAPDLASNLQTTTNNLNHRHYRSSTHRHRTLDSGGRNICQLWIPSNPTVRNVTTLSPDQNLKPTFLILQLRTSRWPRTRGWSFWLCVILPRRRWCLKMVDGDPGLTTWKFTQ
jgi:hypothetical protein